MYPTKTWLSRGIARPGLLRIFRPAGDGSSELLVWELMASRTFKIFVPNSHRSVTEISRVPCACNFWGTKVALPGSFLWGCGWSWEADMLQKHSAFRSYLIWLFFFPLEWASARLKKGWLTALVFGVSGVGIVLSWFSLTTNVGYQEGGDGFVAATWKKKPRLYRSVLFKNFFVSWQLYVVCHLLLYQLWVLRKCPSCCSLSLIMNLFLRLLLWPICSVYKHGLVSVCVLTAPLPLAEDAWYSPYAIIAGCGLGHSPQFLGQKLLLGDATETVASLLFSYPDPAVTSEGSDDLMEVSPVLGWAAATWGSLLLFPGIITWVYFLYQVVCVALCSR